MVQVSWKDKNGKPKRVMGLLEDISATGACLQLEVPLPLGAEIRWDSTRHKFTGHVRYCVYREIGYFVGVEMEAGCRWSKRTFQPQHLLDLRTLVAQAESN